MDARAFLERISGSRAVRGGIRHIREIPARPPRYADPARPIPDRLREILARAGIRRLYAHQARVLDLVRAGRSAVVVAATAGGKSLCYILPIVEALAEDPEARALLLFPTKALAHDQLRTLRAWDEALGGGLRPDAYDGDTPLHRRRPIRESSRIILTNPDMLHVGTLPLHARWAPFFARLRFLVVDEIHAYRGIFGSHTSLVLRRLARVCAHHGSRPILIAASATIANPREHAAHLAGRLVDLVGEDEDGSPHGHRLFVLWSPTATGRGSATDEVEDEEAHGGSNATAREMLVELLREGATSIAFARARVTAELIARATREALARSGRRDLAERVGVYRAGYLPEDRRRIESDLAGGRLRAIVSTTALELGVDIGSLDASILAGYPGSVASTLQQAGRAGRRGEESLAILIAREDPVDRYIIDHPEYLFGRASESACIDPENPFLLADHIGCAAAEVPLAEGDAAFFGDAFRDIVSALEDAGRLRRCGDRWYWSRADLPAPAVNLRSIGGEPYAIVDADGGTTMGTLDPPGAFLLAHPGAIYLQEGETYRVERLDLAARRAEVRRAEVDHFTIAHVAGEIARGESIGERAGVRIRAGFAGMRVRWRPIGYSKVRFKGLRILSTEPLDLPAMEMESEGIWIVFSEEAFASAGRAGASPLEAAAGARNALAAALALLAICDRQDIGGAIETAGFERPAVVLYDAHEGGIGLCQRGFDRLDDLLAIAARIPAECGCENGCPSCVVPWAFSSPLLLVRDADGQPVLPSKAGATRLLET